MAPTGESTDGVGEGRQNAATPQNETLRDPRRAGVQSQDQCYNDVLRCLQVFGSHTVLVANATAERDRLAKRVRRTEAELNKANARQAQFPALAAQMKTTKQSHDEELSRIESKLQSHVRIRDDLMKDLAGRISSGSEELAQLRILKEEARAAISKADLASTKAAQLEKKLANYATSSAFESFEGRQQKLTASLHETDSKITGLMKETYGTVKDLESRNLLFDQRIQQLEDALSSSQQEASQRDAKREAHNQSSIQNLQTIYKGLNDRVDMLYSEENNPPGSSATPETSVVIEAFKSDLQALSEQFQNFRDIQDEKDNAIANDLDKVQAFSDKIQMEIRKSQTELATLRNMIEKRLPSTGAHSTLPHPPPSTAPQTASLPSQMRPGPSANGVSRPSQDSSEQVLSPKELSGRIAHLSMAIDTYAKTLNAHQVSLQSLETRYNNLSTEPIVHQMVAAMQEMYPFASKAQTEIQALRNIVNKLLNDVDQIRAEPRANTEDTTNGLLDKDALIRDLNVERDRINARLDDVAKKSEEVDGKIQDMEGTTLRKLATVLTSAENFRREIDGLIRKQQLVGKLEVEVSELKESLKGLETTLEQQKGKPDPILDKIQTLKQEVDGLRKKIESQLQSDLHETETVSDIPDTSNPHPPRAPRAMVDAFKIKGSASSSSPGPPKKAMKRKQRDFNSPQTPSDRDM